MSLKEDNLSLGYWLVINRNDFERFIFSQEHVAIGRPNKFVIEIFTKIMSEFEQIFT